MQVQVTGREKSEPAKREPPSAAQLGDREEQEQMHSQARGDSAPSTQHRCCSVCRKPLYLLKANPEDKADTEGTQWAGRDLLT